MSDQSPEDLRHQAAEDRKEEVGEKKKEKEKEHLLIMTKLDAVVGWSASGATQEDFVEDWNATTGKALGKRINQGKLRQWVKHARQEDWHGWEELAPGHVRSTIEREQNSTLG